MKKIKVFAILIIAIICILPTTTVVANSPAPPVDLTIEISDYDDKCAYADILIKIDKNDESYVSFNDNKGNELNISESSEIAQYNKDGFISYTFHYNNVYSDNILSNKSNEVVRFDLGSTSNFYSFTEKHSEMRIVLFDKMGNIVQVSNNFSIGTAPYQAFYGYIDYDAKQNTAKANVIANVSGIVFLLFIVPIRIFFSTGIELLVAIPFKVKPKSKIFIVNLITQIILTTVIITCLIWPYWLSVLVMEIFVYCAEYFAYTKIFKGISKKKLLLYTACANTVSLLIGIGLNSLGVFIG